MTSQDTGSVTIDTTIDNQTFSFPFTITGPPATRYVATTGDDNGGANNCRVKPNPCLTVAHAIDRAVDGDTISIADGNYPETNLAVDEQLNFVGESEVRHDRRADRRQRQPERVHPRRRLRRHHVHRPDGQLAGNRRDRRDQDRQRRDLGR